MLDLYLESWSRQLPIPTWALS